MTHPMAVEEVQDDRAVGELDGDEIAGPLLAAIQHSYEQAKALIDAPAGSQWPATPGKTEPHPGTEKIDLRLVKPPAVRVAATPPTATMSLAARLVAEQSVSDGVDSSTAMSGPGSERHTASAPQQPVARVGQNFPDRGAAPPRRRRVADVISRWFPGPVAIG